MKPGRSYHEDLIKDLKKNPLEAEAYLNAALEDGDERVFLLALRDVLEAQGGLTKFSKQTKLNRVSLYKMLSKQGNPEWGSIVSLLRALGIRFQITGKRSTRLHRKAA